MDSDNRTTVKLCARRTGLNFKGRQSGGTLDRPSVRKWPVAQAAVPLGLCPAPLNLVLPPAFAWAEAGSTRHPFFRNLGLAPHAKPFNLSHRTLQLESSFSYPVAPGVVVEANSGRLWLNSFLVPLWFQKEGQKQAEIWRYALQNQWMDSVDYSPEKAGVGGSTPSLATISLNGLATWSEILHLW